MTAAVARLLRYSVRRPNRVLTLTAAFTAVLALAVPGIELRLDARSLVPVDHPALAEADAAAARFGYRDTVILALEAPPGEDVYRADTLQLLADLSEQMARTPGIERGSVVSLATLPRLVVEGDVLDAEPLLQARTEGAGFRPPTPAEVQRIRRETRLQELDRGFPVSRDGRMTAILADAVPTTDRRALLDSIQALLGTQTTGNVTLHLTGSALAQAVLGMAAARDLAHLVPLVLLLVGLVLALAFRSLVPAMIALTEVGVSLVWTAGVLALTGQPVYVTTLVLPVILVVIGVADDVFGLRQAFADPGCTVETREAWRRRVERAFGEVLTPILVTSCTTVVALLSLALVDLAPQRILGLFGALSVVFSTLLTFTLVPALLVLAPVPRLRDPAAGARRRRPSASWPRALEGMPTAVVPAVLVLLVGTGACGAGRVIVEDDWVGNLPHDDPVVAGHRAVNVGLAGANTLDLELTLGSKEAVPDPWLTPEAWIALGRVEEELEADPRVGVVLGPFRDLARVGAALRREAAAEHRADLLNSEAAVDPADLHASRLLLESLGHSPVVERLSPDGQRVRLTLFVRDASFIRIGELLAAARHTVGRHLGEAVSLVPFGDGLVGYRTIGLLVRGQVVSITSAILFEILLLTFLFRSLRRALWAAAPVALSVLVVFGLLGVAGMPLGIASSMFVAVALGIGIDYSTHLVARVREEERRGVAGWSAVCRATAATTPAILISTVAVAVGFSVLAASTIQPNRQLGLSIALSLAVCGILTLVMVPAMALGWLRVRHRWRPSSWLRWRALWRGLVTLLVISAAVPAVAARGHPRPAGAQSIEGDEAQEVAKLLEGYNRRSLGPAGWRQVRLDLAQDGVVTRSYEVLQLWRQEEGAILSLFLLEQPAPLAGTTYLLVEDPRLAAGLEIHLVVSAGRRRVVKVLPSRFREGLLGSDFGYREMTWRIPFQGRRLELPSATRGDGEDDRLDFEAEEVRMVDSTALSAETGGAPGTWGRTRYYLTADPPLLLGADYHDSPDDGAVHDRRLRIFGWHQRQGVWTPREITMETASGRSSTLTLLDFRVVEKAEIPIGWFQPERLPELAEQLRNGGSVVEDGGMGIEALPGGER